MEKRKQEYICPPCTRRKQDPLLPEPQPEPGLSFPVCLTQSPSCEEVEGRDQQQTLKVSIVFNLSCLICDLSFCIDTKNTLSFF